MPSINREWCEITRDVITEANEQINAQLINPLFAELQGISVQELAGDFFKKMRQLMEFAIELSSSLKDESSQRPELDGTLVRLFKALFLRARLAKARECDQQRSRTPNPQVIAALEEKRKIYDGMIRETWFQEAVPEYPPSLHELLTLERIEKLGLDAHFPERQYDEKFHLLQAPSLLLPDLHYYRGKCGVRDIPVAIAFMDIDKFKDLNTEIGHTNVNRHVLPVFMRSVESHIYGHGYAYRMSGDEYTLLMPNADADLAMGFVNGLRKRVTALRFVGTDKTITLSIGLCVADRDCFLTDEELQQKAEQAMDFAKKQGRDRVAGYAGKLFDESELRILTPVAPSSG
ncbi:MAG TPA: GGDEF domain-containing protein [Gemmataceae bacterium]|jgi:diguanylate cyclase (GGDEF)-like protein